MNIAEKALREFNLIPRPIPGEYWRDDAILTGWIARWAHRAAEVDDGLPSTSFDPSMTLEFEDGSRLVLDNPRQAAFHAHAYEEAA